MKTPQDTEEFIINTLEELEDISRHLIKIGRRVVFLQGELGAGKTTFVKSLCRVLGSTDEVTSPTFTLVNEYRDIAGTPIFHIDLYRLESVEDVLQIGIEDYLNSGAWCFVEWPEIINNLIEQGGFIKVCIEANADDSRRILILK